MQQKARIISRGHKKSGIILLVALWVLVILSALALGIGRASMYQMAMTRNLVAKAQSRYLALAGFSHAREIIQRDRTADVPDTRARSGFILEEGQSPEDLFKGRSIGTGHFDVYSKDPGEGHDIQYGFADEEGKINLNGLGVGNHAIFSELLAALGVDREKADTIVASVIDWIDADENVFNPPYGAEEPYYGEAVNYHCKNGLFESASEIMLVRGMTPEIFRKMRDFITVLPRTGDLRVNLDTASRPVLLAAARGHAGVATNTAREDADSLVNKMMRFREKAGLEAVFNEDELELNAREKVLFRALENIRQRRARYLSMRIRGVDERAVVTEIEAIVERESLRLLSWSER